MRKGFCHFVQNKYGYLLYTSSSARQEVEIPSNVWLEDACSSSERRSGVDPNSSRISSGAMGTQFMAICCREHDDLLRPVSRFDWPSHCLCRIAIWNIKAVEAGEGQVGKEPVRRAKMHSFECKSPEIRKWYSGDCRIVAGWNIVELKSNERHCSKRNL